MKFQEHEVLASLCRESFKDFVKEFWSIVVPGRPLIWTWHLDVFCKELQDIAERVFAGQPKTHDLLTNVSPGTTKSTIHSILFPSWAWTRMANARFITASNTDALVTDHSTKSRDVVMSPKYQKCFPEIKLDPSQNAKDAYRNTMGGERRTCTVGGKPPMGFHADFIIIDDPIDPLKALSAAEILAAKNFMTVVIPSRKTRPEVSVVICVMQRLSEDDPSGIMLTWDTCRHICLPAELTDAVRPAELREFYVDGLMLPERHTRSFLKESEARLGQYGYAGQYLQAPTPPAGGMFKVDRMKIHNEPGLPTFVKITRYWDKAGTQDGGAYTVGLKMAKDTEGRFWVLDIIRGQWDSAARERMIVRTAKLDGFGVHIGVEQEPGSGGLESVQATVKRLAGFRVRVQKVSKGEGNKEQRADAFSVQVNAHNVYLIRADWNELYKGELRLFPRGRYKDQVDASSGAFWVLTKQRTIGTLETKEKRSYDPIRDWEGEEPAEQSYEDMANLQMIGSGALG